MKNEDKLEEVEFWLCYINRWRVRRDEAVPERAQLLLDNALLKLESQYPGKSQNLPLKNNKHTLH